MLRIRGGRIWGAVAVIATTLVLTGGVAHGASLSFVKADDEFITRTSVVYTAGPGETNNVVVSWNAATGTFKLTDYGVTAILPELHLDDLLKGDAAPTLAEAVPTLQSCVFLLKSVTCRRPGTDQMSAFVALADGNDRTMIGGSFEGIIAIGGDAGADTLDAAGAARTVLAGGPGDDVIDGGSGTDDLFGGPGADRLRGGAGLDREVFRHDVPSMYLGAWEADNATTGVNVSLDGIANDGQPGEGDNTASDIETIFGTRFDSATSATTR
jgi:Ca2+-binding RTX toxin-like protein